MKQELIDDLVALAQEANFNSVHPLAISTRRVESIASTIEQKFAMALIDVINGEAPRTGFNALLHAGHANNPELERAVNCLFIQRIKHWIKDPNPDLDPVRTSMKAWATVPPAWKALRGLKSIVAYRRVYCKVRDVRVIALLHKDYPGMTRAHDAEFVEKSGYAETAIHCDPHHSSKVCSRLNTAGGSLWVPLHVVYEMMRQRPGIAAQVPAADAN